jgi:hypothetical protein
MSSGHVDSLNEHCSQWLQAEQFTGFLTDPAAKRQRLGLFQTGSGSDLGTIINLAEQVRYRSLSPAQVLPQAGRE